MQVRFNKIHKSQIFDATTKGEVTVAVNAFGKIDEQKDVSLPSSFDVTIRQNFENIYWYKNHDDSEEPGIIKKLYTDNNYLIADLKFNLDKEFSRNLYSDYIFKKENNKTMRHSCGLTALNWQKKNDIREVSEWKLWEVSSLTKWPANFDTPTLAIKSLGSESKILKELESYFNWIALKGLHTDKFIDEVEMLLRILRDQIKTNDGDKPAEIQLVNNINYDYLLTKL